jgi:hypothetical protein
VKAGGTGIEDSLTLVWLLPHDDILPTAHLTTAIMFESKSSRFKLHFLSPFFGQDDILSPISILNIQSMLKGFTHTAGANNNNHEFDNHMKFVSDVSFCPRKFCVCLQMPCPYFSAVASRHIKDAHSQYVVCNVLAPWHSDITVVLVVRVTVCRLIQSVIKDFY